MEQLHGLFQDSLDWAENMIWPVPKDGEQPPAGQRLGALVVDAFAFKAMRAGV